MTCFGIETDSNINNQNNRFKINEAKNAQLLKAFFLFKINQVIQTLNRTRLSAFQWISGMECFKFSV